MTVDDNGMETFVIGGTLDRVQKVHIYVAYMNSQSFFGYINSLSWRSSGTLFPVQFLDRNN